MAGLSIILLAQEQPGGFFGSGLGPIIPFLVIGMLFYLLLIRPERRKRQEMDRMLDNLNKNDQIVTIGGVRGVVVNTAKGSEFVTIKVDEETGTKLRVLRSAIARVITDDKSENVKDGGS